MSDAHTKSNDATGSENPPKSRLRRRIVIGVLLIAVLLLAAELFARFYLGLGDPPLSIADADIEYLFKPSQDIRRFGNRIYYNAYSMRSGEFARTKTAPLERRVMVIGDSVVNGGAQTGQAQLATSILESHLSERIQKRVIVGNISAGSWGPVNMLAYAKKLGLFDADVVVIVLSSGDYGDVPTIPFTPVVGVQPEFPDRKPLFALQEGVMRYLLPRLGFKTANAAVPSDRPPEQSDIERSLNALKELIELARANQAKVIVAQYLERQEMNGPLLPGHVLIQSVARQAGAEVVQLGDLQRESLRAGKDPFRDRLHPNAVGQAVIAQSLLEPIEWALTDEQDRSNSNDSMQRPSTQRAMDSLPSGR